MGIREIDRAALDYDRTYHPKLALDLLAGTVSLAGKAGQFNGRCQKFDPANAQRAF